MMNELICIINYVLIPLQYQEQYYVPVDANLKSLNYLKIIFDVVIVILTQWRVTMKGA